MQWTGLNELREKYLHFFETKDHLRLGSFPLVPKDDPSLLLINSGMAPMKKWFLGQEEPPRHRVTTCQKCIRTPDIERVGITARHGCFFEMLGNFSFQDYFKKEVIPWAWEFLTQELEIPADRLYISVYQEDDEAYDIWTKVIGIPESHMVRLGKEDNFWEHGSGPCGPCSEIYFDRGEEYGCHKPTCGVGCDCDRYMEIWNLVFSQFDSDGKGHYELLAKPNIDTGMGLERLACVMQGVGNLFEVDTVAAVLHHVERIAGKKYGENDKDDISIRVITDHIRATVFMASDGVLPSNEGRGYVMRRLLRRAARHGRMLGINRPFLTELVDTVIESSEAGYPELREHESYIKKVIGTEELRFGRTIDAGLNILNGMMSRLKDVHEKVLSGAEVFKLNDTFGFPLDLTREIAAEAGVRVDEAAFHMEMTKQRERARAERLAKDISGWSADLFGELTTEPTQFDGYEVLTESAKVVALSDGEELNDAIATDEAGESKEGVLVVLDRTPFYAEMGGQQGDAGELSAEGVVLTVADTKNHNGLYAHVARVAEGTLTVGASVTAALDAERRGFLRRNHTATHLLDAALKQVLGEHVSQAGSLVTPEHLRFDFTHFEALSSEQLKAVEDLVNQQIFASKPVVTRVMGIDEAKAAGAVALFGEKYGDVVRVVSVGAEDQPFSRELCGGTHAANTAEIGLFKIISESSTGSNVRRIEAVTSKGALDYMADRLALVDAAAAALKCRADEVPARVENLQAELRETSNKLKKALTGGSSDAISSAIDGAVELDGYKLVVAELQGLEAADLRNVWDTVHQKVAGPVACVVASVTEKGTPALLAAGSDDAVKAGFHAGNVIKQIAGLVDGRGGGRPNMAQAGGKNAAGIADALAAAKTALGA